MTGRTCLKHGVPEWCPEGICRWCPPPDLGEVWEQVSGNAVVTTIVHYPDCAQVPCTCIAISQARSKALSVACPHNMGWYDSNATYTYSCLACGKVWQNATGPKYQPLSIHRSGCNFLHDKSRRCTCGATP